MKRLSVNEALQTLDVQRNAAWDDIRSAYRDRVRSVHPDVNEGNDNDNLVVSLNAAYATLVAATKNGKEPLPVEELPPQEELDAKALYGLQIPATRLL